MLPHPQDGALGGARATPLPRAAGGSHNKAAASDS